MFYNLASSTVMNLSASSIKSQLSYANPVYPAYFADPFVLRVGDEWFAFGTGAAYDSTQAEGEFLVLKSSNLTQWSPLGPALFPPPEFKGHTFWAPEVAFCDGLYYMYYSVGIGDKGHQIRVATSASPAGPYHDAGRLTPKDLPFAIDPCPYRHIDGRWHLFYAADLVEGDRPGTVLFVDELVSMTQLAGSPTLVAKPGRDWQRFEKDRSIYGGVYDWHTLEGPSVHYRNGRIFCMYSGGNWQNDSYGVDFVSAPHPAGPWENTASHEPRTLKTLSGSILGPGHNSITSGPGDTGDFIVYHAWDKDRTARLMRIDPLQWSSEGPHCLGPTLGVT